MNFKYLAICLLLVLSIILNGCYGIKTISHTDKSVSKKKLILVHQEDNLFEMSNFIFNENGLEGEYYRPVTSPVPRLMKTKMLDVYLKTDNNIEFGEPGAGPINIPYSSIIKIEKTRLRLEYLLVIPLFRLALIVVNPNVAGSSF